jgi:hypothetical protein
MLRSCETASGAECEESSHTGSYGDPDAARPSARIEGSKCHGGVSLSADIGGES